MLQTFPIFIHVFLFSSPSPSLSRFLSPSPAAVPALAAAVGPPFSSCASLSIGRLSSFSRRIPLAFLALTGTVTVETFGFGLEDSDLICDGFVVLMVAFTAIVAAGLTAMMVMLL
ncbi:hypothetical protein A2U01_0018513 [Trifolium medium]|uniref:Uncharacterized protein n=1 Tax=Trifolium medium TaxID=97028 RepID=A0A392NEN6_9FABA|nr:hypothetical protein [Trifolium medium]